MAVRPVGTIPALNLVAYPEIIRRHLGTPDNLSIVMGLALGYENEANSLNKFHGSRRPLEEVLRVEGWLPPV